MRKAFIALGVVLIALVIALLAFNQRPKYAGVSLPKNDYRHIQTSRTEIKSLLADLKNFDYSKPKTADQVETDAKKILKLNESVLSSHDYDKLKAAIYGTGGVVTTVKTAQTGHYNIDPSVASTLHNDFTEIINRLVAGISASSLQREEIAKTLTQQVNLDQALYQIGVQHQ
ncbi:molecular chaperone [Lactobacillaceae bacterium L1_55_11]|nr:molecular chaperone [Lactobacillaceae bacterium L1_55_11]